MGDGHGIHKVVLERWFKGCFNFFDTPNDFLDLHPCRPGQERHRRTGSGSISHRGDLVRITVRNQSQHGCPDRIDVAAKGPGQPYLVDLVDTEVVHEQSDAGIQRRLRQLDRTDVVLCYEDLVILVGSGIVENVRACAALGDYAWRGPGPAATDHAVRVHQPCKPQFGNDLDDPGAADPGDAGVGYGVVETGFVGPGFAADHPEPGFSGCGVNPDPFDRSGCGPLAGADLGSFKCGAGGAGGCKDTTISGEDDLGVGADVNDQLYTRLVLWPRGQDHRCGVSTDMAGNARQHMGAGGRVGAEVQFCGGNVHGLFGGEGERRRSEWGRVVAEEQVVHDRVPDQHELKQFLPCRPGGLTQFPQKRVECSTNGRRQLGFASRVHHHVGDPAHEVLTEPDLGVHGAAGGLNLAGCQVAEVSGDGCGAHVDCNPEGTVAQAFPDSDNSTSVPDGHGHGFRSGGKGLSKFLVGSTLDLDACQPPLHGKRVGKPVGGPLLCVRYLDQAEHEDGVEPDVAQVDLFPYDLAVDLACGRDIDDQVPPDLGGTAEP